MLEIWREGEKERDSERKRLGKPRLENDRQNTKLNALVNSLAAIYTNPDM